MNKRKNTLILLTIFSDVLLIGIVLNEREPPPVAIIGVFELLLPIVALYGITPLQLTPNKPNLLQTITA